MSRPWRGASALLVVAALTIPALAGCGARAARLGSAGAEPSVSAPAASSAQGEEAPGPGGVPTSVAADDGAVATDDTAAAQLERLLSSTDAAVTAGEAAVVEDVAER